MAATPPGSAEVRKARVNHFAFEYPTLEDLLETYVRIAEAAIVPTMCLNHGATMSMYYQDPSKNVSFAASFRGGPGGAVCRGGDRASSGV